MAVAHSEDRLDSGLKGQFVEERHRSMSLLYLDFVCSHFEPVHLNNFSLISSYTKTSRPRGQLPAKQKVGDSRSLQGTVVYGPAARETPLHIHHRTGPDHPDSPAHPVALAVWRSGPWPALRSRSPWGEAVSPSVMILLAGHARCVPRNFPLPINKLYLALFFPIKKNSFF